MSCHSQDVCVIIVHPPHPTPTLTHCADYAVYTQMYVSMLLLPCVTYLATAFPTYSFLLLLPQTLQPLWSALLVVFTLIAGLSGFARVWFRMRESRNWFQLIAIHDEWISAFVVTFAIMALSLSSVSLLATPHSTHATEASSSSSSSPSLSPSSSSSPSSLTPSPYSSGTAWHVLIVMALINTPGILYPLVMWPAHNGDHVPHTYSLAVIRRVGRTGGMAVLAGSVLFLIATLIAAQTSAAPPLSSFAIWTPFITFLVAEVVGLLLVTILTILPLSCRKVR